METEYPEITAIQPTEPGETPDGYVKMPIPFVGIYQSLLGGDIDCIIDQEIENLSDIRVRVKEIKIHYDDIYKSIALYTADLLGIEGAIYAGTVCPKYYNFADDQPYLFVPKKFYVELRGKFVNFDEYDYPLIRDCLEDELYQVLDEWYLNEYGHLVADAVYAQWANGTNNGFELLYEALEVIS